MFKVGDKVVCVDNRNSTYELTVGREYIVEQINYEKFVHIRNNSGDIMSYFSSRFKLASLENIGMHDKEKEWIKEEVKKMYENRNAFPLDTFHGGYITALNEILSKFHNTTSELVTEKKVKVIFKDIK